MAKHDFTKPSKSSQTPNPPQTNSLAKIRNNAENPIVPEPVEVEGPMLGKVEQWPIKYRDENGKMHNWTVTSEVPTIDSRIRIGIAASQLAGGISWDHLPAEARQFCYALARFAFQLSEVPSDMEAVLEIDPEFVVALSAKCLEHETRYFRYLSGEGQGDTRALPRFEIG